MATIPISPQFIGDDDLSDYPTGDGKPVAETPIHRDNLLDGVKTLELFFADDPLVYVSGNMFVYYEKGNPRKHVAPDEFVALGVPKEKRRDAYLVWLEPRGPNVVIELTSKSTRNEDLKKKKAIYQDKMPVPEYFLFDPREEYLKPSLQGYRLRDGVYVPIESIDGRLPSTELGLELERSGEWLRFYDPASDRWIPTLQERVFAEEAAREHAEQLRKHERMARERAEAEREGERIARQNAEGEAERLRRELEQLRRRLSAGSPPTDQP
jgi:Uma2 family endonuclease